MPPKAANKKRKAVTRAAKEADQDKSVWLLTFVNTSRRGQFEENREVMVFSTKERAIAAMPKLMDEHCPHGKDWRNGLKGFGRRKEENYLYYQYFGNKIGDDGGVLISNEDGWDGARDDVSVHLKRMQLDPPNAWDETPVAAEEEDEDDDDAGNQDYSLFY